MDLTLSNLNVTYARLVCMYICMYMYVCEKVDGVVSKDGDPGVELIKR